ncbi:MAG: quinone-dependent dihydroorotate dehydrogenase [Chitinophagaceae bacterium]|nr:quinone-dependent dihydroorotate dehydrogenase [Chitinophagaceae bacterium]
MGNFKLIYLRRMYALLRKMLFLLDAERAHYFSMNALRAVCAVPGIKALIKNQFDFTDEKIAKEVFGLKFKNPVGLGAGFDKNALYLGELEALGFGFVEIGTVTPKPQAGNEKPRLFRLPEDQALINRMGFNNDGVKVIAERLRKWKSKIENRKSEIEGHRLIVGGNIGKNKATPNDGAWRDYEICFKELFECVDYFVVNVSSPNTPGLRALQEKDALEKILSHLQNINTGMNRQKPLLLKIAPDLTEQQLDDIIKIAATIPLSGLVITNTTISRSGLKTNENSIHKIGAGGLSGRPLQHRSDEVLNYIHQKTNGSIPVIASGGIFTGDDAKQKFSSGASLVQVWTGFIYEGPAIVKNICRNLALNT